MGVFGRRGMLITDMLRHVLSYVFIGTISNYLLQRPFSLPPFINAHHNINMTTVQLTEILLTKHLDRVGRGLVDPNVKTARYFLEISSFPHSP